MRKYLLMAVLVILVTFGTYLYFFYFKSHQEFVIDSQKWSNFGGFIGGVLGPILSALALIAVSETLQNQKAANEHSQKFDEINMRTEDLENISKQFESMIHTRARKLHDKSVYEAINDSSFGRSSTSQEIKDSAKVVIDTLINIASIILVIEEKKKLLFKDEFSALAFKQTWIYKYAGFGNCAYKLIDPNSINTSQKDVLERGLGIK
ncbi:hypothetical protein L7E50_003175 [Vibrio parahaemolyticus]|nr:hypothetical protein [Vibrio parahaemolyticus]